ncbi:MAG TPA: DUF3261 domain-containing protein [Candidatus Binatia bacterium]|nr:DUF3261 domain-containing protein [Candidatus Binatia bacterium]
MLRAVGGVSAVSAVYFLGLLASCAQSSQPPRLRLQLAPATFGASLSLQQHLIVQREGRIDEVEAALEIDADRIHLVVLAMNQRVLSLRYDGRSLESWRHPALPLEVRDENVLQDMQLALWPLESLRQGLPAGWRIEENGLRRTLLAGELPVTEIYYSGSPPWSGTITLVNLQYGYRLTIESVRTDQ